MQLLKRRRKKNISEHNSVIYKKALIITSSGDVGYFDHLLFIPFQFIWQIIVSVAISVTCIMTFYVSFFYGQLEFFSEVKIIYIDYLYSVSIFIISETIFLVDLFCLTMHKLSTKLKISRPYTPVSKMYILIGMATILPSFLTLSTITYHDKMLTWSFIRILVIFRLYRTFMIYNYLLASVYFSRIVIIFFFISTLSVLTTILSVLFTVFYWGWESSSHKLSAEEILPIVIPMLNTSKFESWKINTQQDIFIFSHYIIANALLGRGEIGFTPGTIKVSLWYQLVMMFTMFMRLILLAMFSAIEIHQHMRNVHFNATKEKLKIKLLHMGMSKKINAKIMNWYHTLWNNREGIIETKFFELLPAALYQDCTLDIFCTAFKHSHIFKEMDNTLLAALALNMRTRFHCTGDVLYDKGMLRDTMCYIHTGVIHVMSSIDDSSPLVSLFPGTCFGESALIKSYRCSYRIVCATYCELKILSQRSFNTTIMNFPEKYKELKDRINLRYRKAELLHAMKEIKNYNDIRYLIGLHDTGPLKRIKRISREIDKEIYSNTTGTLEHEDKIAKLSTGLEDIKSEYIGTTADYLDSIAISQSMNENNSITFIRTNCPVVFHPISPFIKFWNTLVLMCVVVMSLLIPYEAGIARKLNKMLFALSILIQLIFMLDLLVQCSFAIIKEGKIIDKVCDIFYYRVTTKEYKADILGSIPLNFFAAFYESVSVNSWGLLKLNCVLRAWRIIEVCNNTIIKSYNYRKEIVLFIHTCYFVYFISYWSMIFNLLSCYNNKCNKKSMWIMTEGMQFKENSSLNLILKSILKILLLCLGEGNTDIQPYTKTEHIATVIMASMFLFLDAYIVAGICATEVHSVSTNELQKYTIVSVLNFSKRYQLTPDLEYRIIRHLKILKYKQVQYSLIGNVDLKYLSADLRKKVKLCAWVNTMLKVPLFIDTDQKFLNEIIDYCKCIIIPSNEVVMYSGLFAEFIYIIKRGYCQIISRSGRVEGIKGKGWSFGSLETVLGILTIKSVRTLTSCEFLVISKSDFHMVLNKFPDHRNEIKKTKTHCRQLFEIPIVEGAETIHFHKDITNESFYNFGYDMAVGSKAEKEFLQPFIRMFGYYTLVRFLLLRLIILPSGNAVWILEIIRGCLALCSCLVFPAKIIFINYSDFYHGIFLFLDITAYIDMYVRLHVGYYNDKGILVTHPLMTAKHYIKSSFILDLLGCFPFELLFSRLATIPYASYWMCYNRVVQIHRIIGFLSYIYTNQVNSGPFPVTIKYFIILIIAINLMTSISFLNNCEIDKSIDFNFETYQTKGVYCPSLSYSYNQFGKELTPAKTYILFQFFVTTLMAQLNIAGAGGWGATGIFKLFVGIFGYLITVHLMGHISALVFNQNINLTYQHKVKRLMIFLDKQGVNKDLKEEFNQFYNTLWDNHQGKNPKENLLVLNNTLRSDIIYHVYGKYLREYTIFGKAKDTTFFRTLLSRFDPLIYHKGAVIVREGFVNSKVFLVNEGYVNTFAGKRLLMRLKKGAFFGNLSSSQLTQQSTTFLAETAVEVMVLKSVEFFNILQAYPHYKELYMSYLNKSLQQGITVIPSVIDHEGDTSQQYYEKHEKLQQKKLLYMSKRFGFIKPITDLLSSILVLYAMANQEFTIWMVIINYFLDVVIMMLIIINCYLPFQNVIGEYVTDLKKIRLHYRKKLFGFWLDIITILPFQTLWFLFNNERRAYVFLHFNRLLRYAFFWAFLRERLQKISSKQFRIRVIHLIIHFYTLLYVLAAAGAILYSYFDREAIPSTAYYRCIRTLQMITLVLSGFSHYSCQLTVPYYYTIMVVYRNMQMVITMIANAIIAGYFLFFIEIFYYNILNYLEEQYAILFYLNLQRVGIFLYDNTKSYLKFLWDFNQGSQYPKILSIAPKTLQLKLYKTLYDHHIKNHFIFSKCQQHFVDQILLYLNEELILPEGIIVRNGTKNNTMYFIHKGQVKEYIVDKNGKEKLKNVLLEDESFGTKQGLYEQTPHTSTYRAHTTAVILKLNFKLWSYLLHYFPAEKKRIYKILNEYNAATS